MRSTSFLRSHHVALVSCAWLVLAGLVLAAAPGTKTITFQDLMKFRAIQTPAISENGTVVAYALQPDRGDGEAVVHELATGKTITGAARRPAGHLEEQPLGGDAGQGGLCRQRENRQGQAEARHGARGRVERHDPERGERGSLRVLRRLEVAGLPPRSSRHEKARHAGNDGRRPTKR